MTRVLQLVAGAALGVTAVVALFALAIARAQRRRPTGQAQVWPRFDSRGGIE